MNVNHTFLKDVLKLATLTSNHQGILQIFLQVLELYQLLPQIQYCHNYQDHLTTAVLYIFVLNFVFLCDQLDIYKN